MAEVRKHIDRIVDETARVGRIVADLLAFSRRSKPQRIMANINPVISNALAIIGHKLKLMNVEVRLALSEDVPPILCDASQMQQVLINLVINGAEATQGKAGARVTIATDYDRHSGSVILRISDNGEGIPPEYLPKIFDPFFTTKGVGKGVGLGLAVVYGIVHAHRGDIEAKSEPRGGTVITVTLPCAEQEGEHAVDVAEQQG